MAEIHSITQENERPTLAEDLHKAIAARDAAADAYEASNYADADESAFEEAHDRLWGLIGDIAAQPAASMEGLRVKARVLKVAMAGDIGGIEGASADRRLLASMLSDLAPPPSH
jgi:hypothetical protein